MPKPVPDPHPAEITLRMPVEAAETVVQALDLYSRLGMGQWQEVARLGRFGLLQDRNGEAVSMSNVEIAEEHLAQASERMFGFPRNASHGIHSPRVHESFRRAWAVCKAVRHRLAWDRKPEGGLGVAFDEPLDAENAAGVTATSATQEESLEQLPPGMLLTRRDDQWAVVQPQEKGLTIIAQSTSLQTAIQKACNLEKGPARSLDF